MLVVYILIGIAFFSGYDAYKKLNWFDIKLGKALYMYYLADLYLYDEGLVVAGKYKNMIGIATKLPPFGIFWQKQKGRLDGVPYKVSFIGSACKDQHSEIEFHDADYSNNIKLCVKGEEVFQKISKLNYKESS